MLIFAEAILGNHLLGHADHDAVAGRRKAEAFAVVLGIGAARFGACLALTTHHKADIRVARVVVLLLGENLSPVGQQVREVVPLAVAAGNPLGHRVGVVERGGPLGLRGLDPEDLPLATAHDNRRRGLQGQRYAFACGVVVAERLGQGGGYEVVAAVATSSRGESNNRVVGVVKPIVANHAVHRGHGSRREGCQRYGGGGLLVVVTTFGEVGTALHQALKATFGEVVGIALQISGAHRAYDNLHHQTGRFGRGLQADREQQQYG